MHRAVLFVLGVLGCWPCCGAGPKNLALRAQACASSEYSPQYAARLACDGAIPSAASGADAGKAWCAEGNDHPQGVLFSLQWPEPVRVAEIVYYGRTEADHAAGAGERPPRHAEVPQFLRRHQPRGRRD